MATLAGLQSCFLGKIFMCHLGKLFNMGLFYADAPIRSSIVVTAPPRYLICVIGEICG